MTIRYLLLAGGSRARREEIAERVHASERLPIAHRSDQLTALISHGRTPSRVDAPLVIGDLYAGSTSVTAPGPQFDGLQAGPAALARQCWGRYVAAWSTSTGQVRVLRDPSGALPCYYRSVNDLTLIASDLDLLTGAVPLARELNWAEITRILGAGDLRSAATGLAGISELPAGDCLAITPGTTRRSSTWTPAAFAPPCPADDIDEAAARLRAACEQVMTALGHSYPKALATVSGGLDSSIVALSLAPVVQHLTCLTVATVDPSGDERHYARLVADAAPADYREAFFNSLDIDLLRSQAEHLPRPIGRPFMQSLARIIADAANQVGAGAVFNGSGGDNVFCFLQSVTPLVDRIAAQGVLSALPTVRDISIMSNASYLEVAAAAWRRLRSPYQRSRWRHDTRFLTPSASREAQAFDHPWLDVPAGTRPGTAAHIAMILRAQQYQDRWRPGDGFESIDPLLAQPIVECCLSIPSWAWCSGGSNRAIARLAYADRLPPALRSRSWKGGPEGFVGRLAEQNRTLIRGRLVDGELAAHDIIDRRSVATMLDDPRPLSSADALRLLNLCDAEAWVRAMS